MAFQMIVKIFAMHAAVLLLAGSGQLWGSSAENNNASNGQDQPDAKKKSDTAPEAKETGGLDGLQGKWEAIYFVGAAPAVESPQGTALRKPKFLIIDKDKQRLTWDNGDANDPARLVSFYFQLTPAERETKRIDISLETKRIDISLERSFQGADLIKGHYNLERDRLLINASMRAGPVELAKDGAIRIGGRHYFGVILRRVQANDPQAAAKAAEALDFQALRGQWRIMKIMGADDGEIAVGGRFLFRDNTLKILPVRNEHVHDALLPIGPILLNTKKNPKEFDFFRRDAGHFEPRSGIYRVDKDRLEICWRLYQIEGEKAELPKEFKVDKEATSIQLVVLTRIDAAAEKQPDDKTRLIDLQKALVEALQEQMNGLEARLQAGRDSVSTLMDARQRLMDAKLELATDKNSRIQVMEEALERLLMYEKLRLQELAAGKALVQEVDQVKAKRLMVQIQLEKEKAK